MQPFLAGNPDLDVFHGITFLIEGNQRRLGPLGRGGDEGISEQEPAGVQKGFAVSSRIPGNLSVHRHFAQSTKEKGDPLFFVRQGPGIDLCLADRGIVEGSFLGRSFFVL